MTNNLLYIWIIEFIWRINAALKSWLYPGCMHWDWGLNFFFFTFYKRIRFPYLIKNIFYNVSPLFFTNKLLSVCPVDVVMSQDTPPPSFYYDKNMMSYGCCHVTGHVVLWMLSCDRTRCPVDGVMSQDTPTPVLLLLKTWFTRALQRVY